MRSLGTLGIFIAAMALMGLIVGLSNFFGWTPPL
jgi:hypothetical protein